MCPLFSLSNVLYILAFPKFFSPKRCKLRVSVLTIIKRYKLGAGWLEALFSVWEYWIIDVNLIHIHIYFKVGEEDKTEKVCLLSATLGHSSVFILVCILVNLRLRRCTEWPWIISTAQRCSSCNYGLWPNPSIQPNTTCSIWMFPAVLNCSECQKSQ